MLGIKITTPFACLLLSALGVLHALAETRPINSLPRPSGKNPLKSGNTVALQAGVQAPAPGNPSSPKELDGMAPDKTQDTLSPTNPPKYAISKYDILSKQNATRNRPHGYAKTHGYPGGKPSITGNISLLSLNAYVDNDLEPKAQKKLIFELIDELHPTIFAGQNLSKDTIEFLASETDGHYVPTNTADFTIDFSTRQHEYFPIYFDKHILTFVKGGSIRLPRNSYIMATYALLSFIKDPTSMVMVINTDMFSDSEDLNNAMLKTIINNIKNSQVNFEHIPIIFMGTVNKLNAEMKQLINSSKINLIKRYGHGNGAHLNTFHAHRKYNDGIQRDFILVYEKNKDKRTLVLNYARILLGFDVDHFNHYPLHSIMTHLPTSNRPNK